MVLGAKTVSAAAKSAVVAAKIAEIEALGEEVTSLTSAKTSAMNQVNELEERVRDQTASLEHASAEVT